MAQEAGLVNSDLAIMFMLEWGHPLERWQEDIVRRAFAQELHDE